MKIKDDNIREIYKLLYSLTLIPEWKEVKVHYEGLIEKELNAMVNGNLGEKTCREKLAYLQGLKKLFVDTDRAVDNIKKGYEEEGK